MFAPFLVFRCSWLYFECMFQFLCSAVKTQFAAIFTQANFDKAAIGEPDLGQGIPPGGIPKSFLLWTGDYRTIT